MGDARGTSWVPILQVIKQSTVSYIVNYEHRHAC